MRRKKYFNISIFFHNITLSKENVAINLNEHIRELIIPRVTFIEFMTRNSLFMTHAVK